MKKLPLAIALFAAAAAVAAPASAAPIAVTQAVSGSAGDWTYRFNVANHVGEGQRLYFFGLRDGDGTVADAPAGYAAYPGYAVNGTTYNLAWLTDFNGGIASGQSLGGFTVHDTAQAAKTGFSFFGYTYADGAAYAGGDNVGGQADGNPAFEVGSTAGGAPVPEPAAWALLLLGFAGLGHALRGRAETGERIRFT